MKTHCVRADSSQALTSDIRSFIFLTDSSESQGSRIPYLLCILSARSSWIFLLFPNAEVPFAIPHKGKNQGNFTGKYCTVLIFGSDGCSDCSCPDLKHHYCLDHLPSPPLKLPAVFVLWGSAKRFPDWGTEKRKSGEFLDAPFRIPCPPLLNPSYKNFLPFRFVSAVRKFPSANPNSS